MLPLHLVNVTWRHPVWSGEHMIMVSVTWRRFDQSVKQLIVGHTTVLFDNLSPGPLWSSSWYWTLYFILHEFLHPVINHHLLFAAHAHTNAACSAAIPMLCHLYLLSLSAPYLEICLLANCHTSTWPFSFVLAEVIPHFRLTSMQHTASHTTMYNLPLIINDTSILVSSGTNCLNLFQPIQHLHPHSACHLGNKTYPLTSTLHWPQYTH